MKKSDIYVGIGYTLFGIACISIALLTEFKLEGILWGLGGAGIGPGVVMILRFIHWSKPELQTEYAKRLKQEQIEMSDERKIMLRDKSGCITYRIMLGFFCLLILIFSVISTLGYLMPFSKYIVFGLVIMLVFQYICGIIVFNYLSKRL